MAGFISGFQSFRHVYEELVHELLSSLRFDTIGCFELRAATVFQKLAILWVLSMAVCLAPMAAEPGYAATAKKKVTHKRADFTPEQRAKMMEEARKICRTHYGAGSTVYKIDLYEPSDVNREVSEDGYARVLTIMLAEEY